VATTIPSLKSWAVGELANASMLNSQIRDPAKIGISPPWAFVALGNPGQTIGNNSWTEIEFNRGATVDTDGMYNALGASDNVISINTKGLYDVRGQVIFDVNSTKARGLAIDKVGASPATIVRSGQSNTTDGHATGFGLSFVEIEVAVQTGRLVPLNPGDQLKLVVYQNSGGDLTALGSATHFYTWISVRWIRAWA
jgi:hypothetical protein